MKARFLDIIYAVLLSLSLTACGSSTLTQHNYELIKPGMPIEEVISILGQPSSSSSLSFGDITGTSVTWESRNTVIAIQFFNGRVKVKRFIEGVSIPREK